MDFDAYIPQKSAIAKSLLLLPDLAGQLVQEGRKQKLSKNERMYLLSHTDSLSAVTFLFTSLIVSILILKYFHPSALFLNSTLLIDFRFGSISLRYSSQTSGLGTPWQTTSTV